MLTAKDIMTGNPKTIFPDVEIGQAVRIMLEERINGLPVVDRSGKLLGIICQSDLIAAQRKMPLPSLFTILDGFIPLSSMNNYEHEIQKMSAVQVSQAMTRKPVTVSPDTPLEDIATLMVEKKFHTIPVVENKVLVGVVGKEDVLRTLTQK